MYFMTIRNDFLRSKAITIITMLFVAAAAMLLSLAMILVLNLAGAIDNLMLQAKTPHFMQMHSGELDKERLDLFAGQLDYIDQFQVVEFINVEGSQIMLGEQSLTNSLQDNGFIKQSAEFDFLLDLDGKIINAVDGELYVPIYYMRENKIEVGERALILEKEFEVAGFLRDSQMNSALSSSKRFLVSDNDYAELENLGGREYLIEFRLKDLSMLGALEAAYVTAGLEANGPTITYRLFRMMNAISDGMMVGVIILVSVLVVAIAFMCIRFTLLAKIEDDYREIGVMKAIGITVSDIKKIYLAKYAALAALGTILGYLLALMFKGLLLENIRLYMGESENAILAMFFGAIAVLLVFTVIVLYVNAVLNRFRKISAAEAIRFGTVQEKRFGAKGFCLSKNSFLGTNTFLGIKDVLSRKGLYFTMLVVLVLAAFMMIVPQNLYNTISAENFITYMGVGNCDLRIDIQQTDMIAEKTLDISRAMENDDAIVRYASLITKTFNIKVDDGSEQRIIVELGDHSVFPIMYAQGRAPESNDEIALSVINAQELAKEVGDNLVLLSDGSEKTLTISGIYSDVTNGGKTAKAVFDDPSAETMWSIINAQVEEPALIGEKVVQYKEMFSYAKVSDIEEFVAQTYGSTVRAIESASYAATAAALLVTGLVTLLFMKMLVAKERYSIAVMKAFGFTNADIKRQFAARAIFVLILGVLLGTFLANTLGENIAGMVIAYFGAASFEFVINPFTAYLVTPFLMFIVVLGATILGVAGAGQLKISEHIKE